MNVFPSNWYMPEYPLAALAFGISCFIFAWSTYNFAMGLALHGKMIIDEGRTTFTNIVYHYSAKVGLWGGSISFTYMMAYMVSR